VALSGPWAWARSRPPYDTGTSRRLDSPHTPVPPARPRTLATPMITQRDRYPGASNDGALVRDRTPVVQRPYFIPPGNSWVDYTGAGPVRSTVRMINSTYRVMGGTSNTRAQDFTPTGLGNQNQGHGMHTTPKPATARTIGRYQDTAQMSPPRADRLIGTRYTGQSYSQTTTGQGR
jgi:hypothetical protein